MSNDGAVHPTLGQCHVPTLIGKFNYVEKGEAETRVSPPGTAQALGGGPGRSALGEREVRRPPAASHTVPRQSSRPLPRGSPKRSENACPRRLVHSPNVCPHKTGKGGMDRHPHTTMASPSATQRPKAPARAPVGVGLASVMRAKGARRSRPRATRCRPGGVDDGQKARW